MDDKKFEIRRKYDETAKKYDNRYENIQKRKYQEVLSRIRLDKNQLFLDIGGGTGLLLDFLKEAQQNIICCDISLKMLKEGKKKVNRGMFVCADSELLPIRKESIATVTCFSMFQNLENPQISLEQIYVVLKNKSYFILTLLDKELNIKELQEIIEKKGYKILATWNLSIEDIALIAKKEMKN